MSHKLVGTWRWTKIYCSDVPGAEPTVDKQVIVIFRRNGTFRVTEDGSVATEGTWTLRSIDHESWMLDLSKESMYLYGIILFCGNQVKFAYSYLDGCDFTFEKDY